MDGDPNRHEGNMIEVETCFGNALKGTYERIHDSLQRVGSLKYDHAVSADSLKNMNEWKIRFEREIENLQLVNICEDVVKTIQFAVSSITASFLIDFSFYNFSNCFLPTDICFSETTFELLRRKEPKSLFICW